MFLTACVTDLDKLGDDLQDERPTGVILVAQSLLQADDDGRQMGGGGWARLRRGYAPLQHGLGVRGHVRGQRQTARCRAASDLNYDGCDSDQSF